MTWAAGLALLASLISRLSVEWSINPQYSYGWGAVALAGYLFWLRWETQPGAGEATRFQALAATLSGLLLASLLPVSLLHEANPDWRLMSWAHAAIVAGLWLLGMWRLGGSRWVAHFGFPILFLLIAVPWPTKMEEWFVQALMRLVARVTTEAINWFGVPAVQRGNVIDVPSGSIGVSEACSGLRSFQGTLMAALFFGELNRFKAWRRVFLVLFGVCLALALNTFRTFSLSWIHIKFGPAALGRWHDPAGFIVLLMAFLGIGATAMMLKKRSSSPGEKTTPPTLPAWSRGPCYPSAKVGIAVVAVVIAVECSVEMWFRLGEKFLQPRPLWSVEWPEAGPGFRFEELDESTLAMLRCNQARTGVWKRPNGSEWTIFWLRWEPGRTATQLALTHRPEVCLPAAGLTQKGDHGLIHLDTGSLSLPFKTYLFDYRGRPMHVFFCVWESLIAPGETPEMEVDFTRKGRLKAVLDRRRHQGQQILELVIVGPQTPEQAISEVRRELPGFIKPMAPGEHSKSM